MTPAGGTMSKMSRRRKDKGVEGARLLKVYDASSA